MEFLYISIILSVLVLSFPLSLLFLFKKNIKSVPAGKLPPGKTGWPIIGESMEFLSTGWNGHPEKFILDRMSKYSSLVFGTSLMLEDVAVFCGAAGNKFLFSNENKLVTAWWPSSIGKIFPAGNKYKEEGVKAAKMIHVIFKPNALQTYVGMMDYITQRHFSLCWDDKKEVVVVPLAKQFTFALACKIFISVEDPVELARLLKPFECIANGILSIPIDLPGTPLRRAINASNSIMKQLSVIIKQRKIDLAEGKASPSQDILSNMMTTSDENGMFMEDVDIADKILALLVGGYDTASCVCAFIVKYLAELPEVYDAVYKEQIEIAKSKAPGELLNWDDLAKMKYSWNVGCEVLRLAPPLQGTFREATTNFMYNGFSIPKGWKCYWNAYSTHMNPEYFKEPQKFDPSRFDQGSGPVPYAYVPFGGGPRMCPGREYARLEVLVFMHHLVKRFKWEKVIPDEKIVINPLPTVAKGLPIRLYPHNA